MASDEDKPEKADKADKTAGPQTPRRASAVRRGTPNANHTRKISAPAVGITPRSAPAAGAGRQRSATMKPPPATLLGDFLLGRPSPGRKAKQRRMSLEQVKQEMRQDVVRKVQPPGGVRDRVKQWQKTNAAAVVNADALAAPSEPSEVGVHIEEDSVTEEDRVRIKKGLKKKPPRVVVVDQDKSDHDTEKENHDDTKPGSPPKKRVVSDTNWMKTRRSPPRSRSPKTKQSEGNGSPLPKDFLSRPTPNPPVKNKIKDWATRVEPPDEPQVKRYSVSRSLGSGDGIRVSAMRSKADVESERSEDSEIVVETAKPRKPRPADNDGIRVTPTRKKSPKDDGIRVRPLRPTRTDDGIRVYSTDGKTSTDNSTVRASSRQRSAGPSTHAASTHRDASSSERIEVFEESGSDDAPETPTRRSGGRKSQRPKAPAKSLAETGTTITEDVSDTESWTSEVDDSDINSERPSSAPSKLADIPVGYSAFSELNLPIRGQPKRPKTTRTASFKGATNVLKKALNEGKKIITEKVDPPPKPVANQPRSIESWLNKTVDPFVDTTSSVATSPEVKRKSLESGWTDETKTRRSVSGSKSASKRKSADEVRPSEPPRDDQSTEPKEEPAETPANDTTTSSPASLKRSRAMRSASSPLKLAGKKGFRDKLKDAFRGESTGPKFIPMSYPSGSTEEVEIDDEMDGESRDRRRSNGSESSRTSQDDDSTISPEPVKSASAATYPKRRPPTNGQYELSTILSLDSSSTMDSELSSMLSDTTMTQTTAFTKSTGTDISRHRSNKHGLKRRLTKHSDLVSVLSLTEENAKPGRSNSLRSAHSTRRPSSRLDTATIEGLLQEFADDENLYQRELKTLVDGVIPVLLTQFVHNDSSGSRPDLFSPSSGKQKEDKLAKSVVSMGIALEKLKREHRRCPLSDAHRLPQWLESVQSIYDAYLDVWRLDFQDLIVNLAPLGMDDNDSLINAMPRNEDGDVLNEDGERVDVAHLLKKPLVRIKWINKFIKGYRTVTETNKYQDLATSWTTLQDKARRRHKEETARAVDDDATFTDITRVRDLNTLEALDSVKVDRFRQVYAKDSFSLDLQHTNGQRLECQVELISRDNQLFKSDPGDLLIRETGSGGRSWLLFAPITGGQFSARRGDEEGQIVVMIRGIKDAWFQLLTLTTDNDEQILDWLDILGTNPAPPAITKSETTRLQPEDSRSTPTSGDAPLGERRHSQARPSPHSPARIESSPELKIKTTPARYRPRNTSVPTTPTFASQEEEPSTPSTGRTPTQDSYARSQHAHPESSSPSRDEGRSRPLSQGMRPDPADLQKSSADKASSSYRPDGAPPPPAHRSLPSKKSPTISPPVELTPSKVKRRTSSPLKHEYHPSDLSSEGSTSTSGSEDEDSASDSSDDELEAADIPDSMPAISIKKSHTITPTDSVLSDSADSLTPSASASQTGLPRFGTEPPAYVFKSIGSISYWDNKKGCWNDLWPDLCSLVTTPGLIEAYPFRRTHTSSGGAPQEEERPLIALDLTPLVMLRNSTVLDLEIRSPVLSYARLYSKVMKIETSFFRFRTASYNDSEALYMAVHRARMDNAKYKALEEEARVRAFGQHQANAAEGEGTSRRRSWFGRKNSYRVSARAPSQSAGSTSHASSDSASSFLKKIMGGGNQSFNIAMSSVDKQSRAGSGGGASLYGSSSSSATPPRSPSVSAANSGSAAKMSLATNNLKVRLHLLVTASKWEDYGNCLLEIMRPDQGTRQKLRTYQGMEKRVVVTSIPKKDSDKPVVVLDVVLGSRCFTRLGSRGILLNVWEEVKDESGEAGMVPKGGGSGGLVNKWCFQCTNVTEASWIFGLVTQEVVIG